jgi:hypothetical protein
LWVNGTFVAYGPARFVTQYPEYERYDLRPFLQDGENHLRVEVNFYGCSSFQTMPDGVPGFIAGGGTEDGAVDFATPGDWRARVHAAAWRWDAPLFSFAQNPAEICDTRALQAELADAGLSGSVRVLSGGDVPWGELRERAVAYPDYAPVTPSRITAAGSLVTSRTYGFQTFLHGYERTDGEATPKRMFATCLHSERARSIEVGCFWSDLEINGRAVAIDTATALGNHGATVLELREGWNVLAGRLEILTEAWSYLLRLPAEPGLAPHATPDRTEPAVFALSPVFREDGSALPEVPAEAADWCPPEDWERVDGSPEAITPARLMGWDELAAGAVRDLPYARLEECSERRAEEATWALAFEREYYGHPVIEVEAPPGSVLDVGYDDWLREDGCVNLYGANPFTDAADRYILRGGRQTVEVLNPRGGIYLQITLRAPGGAVAALKLHEVRVRRRTTLNEADLAGDFHCGDADFDYAWRGAVRSLCASTDEAYSDCPWRERGSYIGDGFVGFSLHRLVATDLRVGKRTFLNFGRAALPDGQLACCAPSWLRKPHEDFSLIWILWLLDIERTESDAAFVRKNWPVVRRVLAAPYDTHASGLWNTDGRRLFIDWGCDQRDREGEANAVINLFRAAALRAAAELGRTIGEDAAAEACEVEAREVESALLSELWDEAGGRFRPSLSHDSRALHANVLAYAFGIGPRERLLAYLRPHLLANFERGLEAGQFSGHLELYFLYYLLPALGENGEVELAEQLVSEHYGFLRGLGVETLNECFDRAHRGLGSRCHTWSGAGGIYAHRYVLGLRRLAPSDPNRWLVAPRVSDRFVEAGGSVAHPLGTIRVSWKRRGDRFLARAEAPEGVELLAGEGVDLESRKRGRAATAG